MILGMFPGGALNVEPGKPLDPQEVYELTRPSDWLPMPTPETDEMYLLFHIPDGLSSLVGFKVTCSGYYTIELGTVVNGAFSPMSSYTRDSGSKYEAELFSAGYGNLTSGGMKQAMIKVSGTNILTWEPCLHYDKTTPNNFSVWNIVEISAKLPCATAVTCGNTSATSALTMLRYFRLEGTNAITNAERMFSNCVSLRAVLQLDTSGIEAMNFMFCQCRTLVAIPEMDTSSVTNMNSMFISCNSLTAVPELDTSNVTNMNSMFMYCYNLDAAPELDTSSATSMLSMFSGCSSLTTIPELDTSSVENMGSMFSNCSSMNIIPRLNTSSATSMGNTFSSCYNLASIKLVPTVSEWGGFAISLKYCSLSHDAIVDLFNSLPTITSEKAITLTGNPGVSKLTDAEKEIATGKNWTLTL